MKANKTLLTAVAVLLVAALSVGGGWIGARMAGGETVTATQTRTEFAGSGLTYGTPVVDRLDEVTPVQSAARRDLARTFQEQFRAVAGATIPVVVEVNVATRVTQQVQSTPFDFFFGTPRQTQPEQREFTRRGLGSGVIVARDGQKVYVVTNDHVVTGADEIEVVLADGRTFNAELIGGDDRMDVAVVSFETPDEVPIAVLGDSEALYVGDWVFAVGNPLGFESTVTAGIVSAKGRVPSAASNFSGVTDYIQTDAAINSGNSGGALVNLDGDVVGINTWIASQTGGSIGIGFAIPVNTAKRAIADIIRSGEVAYSWLGVQVGAASGPLGADLGWSGQGALVTGVYDGSPAADAGLHPGDIITRIGDREIADSTALVRAISALEPGRRVAFDIVRDGDRRQLSVQTARRQADSGQDTAALWPGLTVSPLTAEARIQLGLDGSSSGALVTGVANGGPAGSSGLRAGDVVTAVNGVRVENTLDFYRALARVQDDEIQFRVLREGRQLILGFVRAAA